MHHELLGSSTPIAYQSASHVGVMHAPCSSPIVRGHVHRIGVVSQYSQILHNLLPYPVTLNELALSISSSLAYSQSDTYRCIQSLRSPDFVPNGIQAGLGVDTERF